MPETPKWLKVVRWICVVCMPIMVLNCWITWNEELEHFEQMLPTSMILVGLTHLAWRAPYKRWTWWESPFILFSVGVVASGAFLFTPEDEERVLAFQLFLGVFGFLAMSYGFFCTAVKPRHPLRKAVIEPCKKVAHFGIVGFDIGLVLCPFAFVFFLLRYLRRGPQKVDPS